MSNISKSFRLDQKKMVVVGSSRGIGKAIALAYAESGADVAVIARNRSELESVAEDIRSFGRRSIALTLDVTESGAVAAAIDRIAAEFGGIDGVVVNAGTNIRKKTPDVTDADWRAIFSLDLDAAFYAVRAAIPHLERSRGRIIFIGSVAGMTSVSTGVAYAAAKAGLAHMTRYLACELGPAGITVNCIAPWYVRTALTEALLADPTFVAKALEVTPMKRLGETDDIVGAAVFFAADASRWISGQVLAIDGGMTAHGFTRPT